MASAKPVAPKELSFIFMNMGMMKATGETDHFAIDLKLTEEQQKLLQKHYDRDHVIQHIYIKIDLNG